MVVGMPGRDAFQIGVSRYSGEMTVTVDVGICVTRSAVRKNGEAWPHRQRNVLGWRQWADH